MENRSTLLSVTGLGALLAVVSFWLHGGERATPVQGARSAPSASARTGSTRKIDSEAVDCGQKYQRGLSLINAHLGRVLAVSSPGKDTIPLKDKIPLQVLIATVPDPYDSHLDWSYDAYIEALEKAFTDAGYLQDRFWLPAATDSVEFPPTCKRDSYAARDKEPGVILFRSRSKASLALLYLVGELPTSGIHKDAFANAVDEWRKLESLPLFRMDAAHTLRIIGPAFSGSVRSLQLALDSVEKLKPARDPEQALKLALDSAKTHKLAPDSVKKLRLALDSVQKLKLALDNAKTHNLAPDSVEKLRLALDSVMKRMPSPPIRIVTGAATSVTRAAFENRATFSATVHSDADLLTVAHEVRCRLGIRADQVAILSESSTLYGQGPSISNAAGAPSAKGGGDSQRGNAAGDSAKQLAQQSDTAKPTNPAAPPFTRGASTDAEPDEHCLPGTDATRTSQNYQFTFPLNLAVLRSAYYNSQAGSATNALVPSRDPGPELSLAEQTRPLETPEIASPQVTVPSLDLAMREITDALNRHGIRAVMIRATDIRDKLMLAEILRRSNRDLIIFVLESHILLARPDYSQSLLGAYIVSTYPLSLENQWWTSESATPKLAFSSDAAIGVYNATLSILGDTLQRIEYSHWTAQGRAAGPPVWVSVVGRNGLMPLAAFSPVPDDASAVIEAYGDSLAAASRGEADPAHIGIASFLVAGALGVMLSLCVFFVTVGNSGPLSIPGIARPAAFFSPSDSASATPPSGLRSVSAEARELLFTSMFLCGGAALTLACSSPILFHAPDSSWAVTWLSCALLVIVTGTSLFALVLSIWAAVLIVGPALRRTTAQADRRPGNAAQDASQRPTLNWNEAAVPLFALLAVVCAFVSFSFFPVVQRLSSGFSDSASAFRLRTAMLASGMSPIAPIALLAVCATAWAWWQFQQVRSTELDCTPFDFAMRSLGTDPRYITASDEALRKRLAEQSHVARMLQARRKLLQALTGALPAPIMLIAACIVAFIGWSLWQQFTVYPESVVTFRGHSSARSFDFLMHLGPLLLTLSILGATIRLYRAWMVTERLATSITESPLHNAFARLPRRVLALTKVALYSSGADDVEDDAARELSARWHLALAAANPPSPANGAVRTRVEDILCAVGTEPTEVSHQRDSRRALTTTLLSCAVFAWEAAGTRPSDEGILPHDELPMSTATSAALRRCEEYVAFEAVVFVESVLRNLRRLSFFLLVALIVSVVFVNSYSITPSSLMKLALLGLLGLAVAILFLVMTGMSRNALLSQLTGTAAGSITWDTTFVLNVVLFSILPLLVLASSEFTSVRLLLFSWLEPAVKAFAR